MENISLRERKKAKTKLALYEASLELIVHQTFRDMKVEDICAHAEVSKVTFFKCFPQKEDILIYYMCIWLTNRWLEIEKHGLRGWAAAEHLFTSIATEDQRRPGMMLRLIGLLAEAKMHPGMPVLSDAEISLLFPGEERQARAVVPRLDVLMRRIVEEATADGEVNAELSIDQLTEMLFTIFYGAYLTAHIMQRRDIVRCYQEHLDILKK
ncbi:TetR/AcrR family transcriptional regulator [Paenibacillus apiarius]|uniref:TetR/AcrR family transcriptional regulator n=1 Tax=Paenibacillus apiarius TaxID=46240 RepID=A0ABT4DTE7_9BACL|nr:TetR/AcrR family transcriptional regulator [Paenibacillus apiarius]MBN3522984.1 TetR/AcrR family transcriptional regulator [Paenibacillus apiarius]MCY9515220.1 TetR/AcrR family transcriptional regulator [Paenibacillus apiarius]MCY9520626.1 TetR/AcrR family transcriptional regulator [Paenibacillus apiarius]MCY9550418.1 TetR/AcrR family transcriptional regulator [Paenibacillus apiarius]MCY9561486.1 TetR/AcrR family transcriptional regulator [Paenibacillus apiarius]